MASGYVPIDTPPGTAPLPLGTAVAAKPATPGGPAVSAPGTKAKKAKKPTPPAKPGKRFSKRPPARPPMGRR